MSSLVLIQVVGLALLGCVPEAQVKGYRTELSEQQHLIEVQQERIHELTGEYALALERQVLCQREQERLETEIEQMETSATLPAGTGGANVTLTYLESPQCDNGQTHWKGILTETSSLGVTFTHSVMFYRVKTGSGWSEPRNVSYYDETTNPFAWPMRLSPNERRETGAQFRGCFSEERHYTSVLFGRDDHGKSVVAMGTVVANEGK